MPKYDLEALEKDLQKVEEEIQVFGDMLKKLLKRKVTLELLIDATKERLEKEKELKQNANQL